MRLVPLFAAITLTMTAPALATADHFNQISPPDIPTGSSDLGWSYNFKSRDSVQAVLSQLRAVCKGSSRYDRQRCAKGTAILNDAYAELQARRAAEAVVAD